MNKFLIACLLSFFPSFGTGVFAQDIHTPTYEVDIFLNECLRTSNYSTTEVLQCLEEGSEAWMQFLDTIYTDLSAELNQSTRLKLVVAQQEWNTYFEKEMGFAANMYDDLDGSIYRIMAAQRKYDLIRDRAVDLDHYLADYTFDSHYGNEMPEVCVFNRNMPKQEVEKIVSEIRFFYGNCTDGLKDVLRVNDENEVVPGSGNYSEKITFMYNPYQNSDYASKIIKDTEVAAQQYHSEWLIYNYGPDTEEECHCIEGEKTGNLTFYYYHNGIESIRVYFHLNEVIKLIEEDENGQRRTHYPPFTSLEIQIHPTIWPSFKKGTDAITFDY